MKVHVKALNSCIQRKADVRRYKDFLTKCGHELLAEAAEADRVLVWTCAFRADHKQNSLRKVEDLVQSGKDVVVCGCLPAIDGEALDGVFSGTSFRWADEAEAMPRLFGEGSIDALQVTSERAVEVPNFADFKRANATLEVVRFVRTAGRDS